MDSSYIPELGIGDFNGGIQSQDMLSSLLEMENYYNPAFPDQIPLEFHFQDDYFSRFGTSQGGVDQGFCLPAPDAGGEALLLDHEQGIDTVSMLLDATADTNHTFPTNEDEMLQYFAADYKTQGDDNNDGRDSMMAVGSMASSTTTSATTWPETASEEVTPSLNVSINLSSAALASGEEDEVDDHMERGIRCITKPAAMNSKNLVSERNRRKRLSQQLLALRALVPNITKMDKRSVLVDALAYVRSIHEEMTLIQEELKGRNNRLNTSYAGRHISSSNVGTIPKNKAEIVQIETEKMEEKRFIVKMTCKGGPAVGGDVVQVIEALGMEITYIALEQLKSQLYMTTVFIRVRKQGKMTEEKLKDHITSTALRSGLSLHLKDP